jgi:hypothetical protein
MSTASKPRAKTSNAEAPAIARPASAARASAPIAAEAIGDCAGAVWSCLNDNGPQPLAKLKKSIDAPSDLVLAAVGWLAREGKLSFESTGKQVTVALV